ncbi:MAG: LysR family transcriptional regulator [Sphingobacteriia bacterium]|nr:LysR family transcriptional regulator [Sphingobacteriia bacterium]
MPKPQKPPGPIPRAGDHRVIAPSNSRAAPPTLKASLTVSGQFWFSIDEIAFLGEERIALLEQIEAQGSITRAARAAGLSYKAAWDAVDAINSLAPVPLVTTATGGRGGGGARLTEAGRRLVALYHGISAEYQVFMSGVNAALAEVQGGSGADRGGRDDANALLSLLRRRSLHTSARNHFVGQVVAVTARPVDAEVQIALSGGQRILAGITNESVDCLRLRPGRQVWALVKTVAVSILSASAQPEPGVNRLCGTVQRIRLSDGPAEVVLALDAGVTIRGVIDASRLEPLGIVEQGSACALFSAASVIIGVDD